MCLFTDDPVRDFEKYDAEQQAKLDKLPECSECGQKIQDEYCFEVNDEYICDFCMNHNHRKAVEDIV